ncbi:MAG: hypothetical protein IJC52_03730, partial [Clostridia bacterium]|nr:hypothetical protein [Clostridia bacterium]
MMIKRNVSFQLTADGSVTPSVPQYGGVKGEHNVTTVGFILNTNSVSVEGDLVRLSFYTGDGAVLSTDLLEDITVDATTDHTYIRYPLPQNLTVAG